MNTNNVKKVKNIFKFKEEKSGMIEYETYSGIPEDFTGICKVADTGKIYHMINGIWHNETGPAVVWKDGSKFWYINGLEHRQDGPSSEYLNGNKHWYYKNIFYGSADDFTNETWKEKVMHLNAIPFVDETAVNSKFTGIAKISDAFYHYKDGQIHRLDGPAIIWDDGHKHWYKEGLIHRANGPAIERPDGTSEWYFNGLWHREDGPAIDSDEEEWWIHGAQYSEEEYKEKIALKNMKTYNSIHNVPKNFTGICNITNFGIYHYKNGKIHNEGGPAVERAPGHKEWFMNGFNHREDGPAVEYADGGKKWCYKNKRYGYDNDFTNETWKEKVKELKRKEEKENMIEFKTHSDIPKDFTGICKITNTNYICHMKDRRYHNENGPAVIEENGKQAWYYMGNIQGYDDTFTNETWKEKVKELKAQQEKTNMIEFKTHDDIPKDFTGVCKVIDTDAICHIKDGIFHNESGSACTDSYGNKFWLILGFRHRENGPAIQYSNGNKEWWYKDTMYGLNESYTNNTWMEKVKELKKQEDNNIINVKNKYLKEQENSKMIEFKFHHDVPKNFTGICTFTNTDTVAYFKDGKIHREDGPAEITDGINFWLVNSLVHREDGPAVYDVDGNQKQWWYNGFFFGRNDDFTIETWKQKVKEVKQLKEQENSKMIEFKNFWDVPHDFTGVCKFICDNSIRHYKNGLYHREDGPAKIFENGAKQWFIDGVSYSENEFKKKVKLTNDFIDNCVASISKSKNDKPKSNLPKIITKATYRIASTQITNIVKESLIKIISKDRNQAIQILNSEFGKAIIQAVCGMVANEINSDNIYVEKISQELLTSSIATVGDVLFDTINTQIPEMLQKTILNFSKPAGTRISNVTNDSIDEIEDETSQNLSLTL